MASNRKVSKDNDDEHIMDKEGSESTLEEGVRVLPTKRENLDASEEAEGRATTGSSVNRGSNEADIRVPRKSLVRASGYMGHVREDKGEALVAGDV